MKLNHKVIGEGFPIVILHGLFGMLDNWQTIGKRLADNGYMVYLIDQRDHGKSPFTNEFSYQILADDLHDFMEENWLYKAHIMGHSMGGKTIMQFSFDHSDFIEKMVVVDVCNTAYKGGHEIIFQAIDEIDVANTNNRENVYNHLLQYKLDEGTTQFLLKNLQRKKESGYEWKMNVRLLKENYANILTSVGNVNDTTEAKTLFIRGENSDYIKEENYAAIHKQFTNAAITTIADAGHWVHADQPEKLLQEVLTFFKTDNS